MYIISFHSNFLLCILVKKYSSYGSLIPPTFTEHPPSQPSLSASVISAGDTEINVLRLLPSRSSLWWARDNSSDNYNSLKLLLWWTVAGGAKEAQRRGTNQDWGSLRLPGGRAPELSPKSRIELIRWRGKKSVLWSFNFKNKETRKILKCFRSCK